MVESARVTDLLVDALAVHRLTRLVVVDKITEPYRDRLIRALYARRGDRYIDTPVDWTARAQDEGLDAPFLAQLVSCRACASIWCAALAVVARRTMPAVWSPLARLLALSSATILADTAA